MLTGVHLLLTYQCTHECDHCFVYAGPGSRGTFDLDGIRTVLDQSKELGSVEWIYFEGGEPFLFYPVLLEGLRAAREHGFRTGVVTNAYWATSERDAELWLRPLRDLGVEDFCVSDDALHHGTEDPSPARRALAAAGRLGLPSGSITIPDPGEGEGVRYRGRAADRLVAGLPRRPAREFTECPDEDFENPGRVHVDAAGNVHLCQGILLGNLWRTPLAELLSSYEARLHPIAGPLAEGGPAALASEHGLDVEGTYVSACHLCYRTRQLLRAQLPEYLGPPQVYGEDAADS